MHRPVAISVLVQHFDDLALLRATRSILLRSPQIELVRLARLDERLSAHVDGLLVAGDLGYRMALESLESPSVGSVFAVAALAAARGDQARLLKLLALFDAVPEAPRSLASALGWVSTDALRGWTVKLLAAADPWQRWLGLAACAAHRADPGDALPAALAHRDAGLRVRAARMAGQLGRSDLVPALLQGLGNNDPAFRRACAGAAVLLGDRSSALDALRAHALKTREAGPRSDLVEALQLSLLALPPDCARVLVRELVATGAPLRLTIRATAWAGEVQAIPWLIRQMADPVHARVAGEAFSTITGVNLALLDLERKHVPEADGGPTYDPSDDDVALDEDESLPWPDVDRVQAWWGQHQASMPSGTRCFMGAVPDAAHCLLVLREGGQRQRYVAALLLSLMQPGTPLFNIAAPAWRQQRALGLPVRVM